MAGSGVGNTRVVRDETGQELWESVTTEYTPYGEISGEVVVNRDGSTIRSELASPDTADWTERHEVRLADGTVTIFENLGSVQTIYDAEGRRIAKTAWTEQGPQAVPFEQAEPADEPLPDSVMRASVTLYNWLANRDRADDKVTVFAFSMDAFRLGTTEVEPPSSPPRPRSDSDV